MGWQRLLLAQRYCIFSNDQIFIYIFLLDDKDKLKTGESPIALYQPDSTGEIIIYQPDSSLKPEVRLVNETVWLTQEQISLLFGTQRPAITKHLNNIYKTGELDENSTCSILEHMGNDSMQRYKISAHR
jgi:CRISPR/Cas system CSM-associated protein Csm3 (group 7 of RAMP superfamily)